MKVNYIEKPVKKELPSFVSGDLVEIDEIVYIVSRINTFGDHLLISLEDGNRFTEDSHSLGEWRVLLKEKYCHYDIKVYPTSSATITIEK